MVIKRSKLSKRLTKKRHRLKTNEKCFTENIRTVNVNGGKLNV